LTLILAKNTYQKDLRTTDGPRSKSISLNKLALELLSEPADEEREVVRFDVLPMAHVRHHDVLTSLVANDPYSTLHFVFLNKKKLK